ncbi:hypothetical protein [Bacillus cereus]|uniref:hypothetical protein n=1 Tax=Bacillus cereus TaxID=1396 RepID=UPI000BF64ABB|nr:hypothetical protein [Bacillus cereus]PFV41938.1 hypothetical protein COL00_24025 [Bacillus cereus]PGQ14433.1 hypothetical protein COA09_11070 [Bacillus cereus]PGS51895.1 hypothetical protein COC67_25010 [Bacillus cereus]PGV01497.1 hypothetical protein COD77_21685 [Bacillus cereus]
MSNIENQLFLKARWYTINNSVEKLVHRIYDPDAENSLPYKKLLSGTYYFLPLPEKIEIVGTQDFWTKLGHFLFWSAGLLRKEWNNPYVDHRSFPSPRSIYATEFYLMFRSANVDDSTWCSFRYSPTHHRLELAKKKISQEEIKEACGLSDTDLQKVEFFMMINSNVWRMGCKYGDFAYRLILLEAGHAIENLIDLSGYYGWKANGQLIFIDQLLASFIGIDLVEEPVFSVFRFFSCNENSCDRKFRFKKDGVQYNVSAAHSKSVECRWQEVSGMHLEQCKEIRELEEQSRIHDFDTLHSIRMKLGGKVLSSKIQNNDISKRDTLEEKISDINSRHSGRGPFGISGPKKLISQVEINCFFNNIHQTLRDLGSIVDCDIWPNIYMVALEVEGFQQGVYRMGEDLVPTLLNSEVSAEIMRNCYLDGNINFTNLPLHWFITADIEKYLTRFGQRGYRIAHLLAGIISQKILLAAGRIDLFARPIMAFDDLLSEKLLKIHHDNEVILEQIIVGTNSYQGWQISTLPIARGGKVNGK